MRNEKPLKRRNPSGEIVWVARCTDSKGRRRSVGTFQLRREAEDAIRSAYGAPPDPPTFGDYAETWIERHPRGDRTNRSSSRPRLNAVRDVEIEGRPLADWPLAELRRRHANELVDHMLREEGRAATGAQGVLRTISMLCENAIDDEVTTLNFVRNVKVKANDPRVQKKPRKPRVWTFDQMREFASAGRAEIRGSTAKPNPHKRSGETLFYSRDDYETMLLVFALTGLRIGEVLALRRRDFKGDRLHVAGSAWEGKTTEGDTAEKRHVRDVPCPPTLAAALDALPKTKGSLLFPTSAGTVWRDRNFRRDVWGPAQLASGLPIRPHECRHSYVSNLRAAGVDPADLAAATGHDVETATRVYTHAAGRSDDAIRSLLG